MTRIRLIAIALLMGLLTLTAASAVGAAHATPIAVIPHCGEC